MSHGLVSSLVRPGSFAAFLVAMTACEAPGPPASVPEVGQRIGTTDLESRLRSRARLEGDIELEPRELPAPPGLSRTARESSDPATTGLIGPDAAIEIARSLVDEQTAPLAPLGPPGDPSGSSGRVPRPVVRDYIAGRTALASGDPAAALGPLESAVRGGGGRSAWSAFAEALDGVGRRGDGFAIRREMVRRGWADPDLAIRHVDELVQRGMVDEAIAVAAASTCTAGSPLDRARMALLLELTLEQVGRGPTASMLRRAMASDPRVDLGSIAASQPALVAGFWRRAGDDAATNGNVGDASRCWQLAESTDPSTPVGHERLGWAALALGRDASLQVLVLDTLDRTDTAVGDLLRSALAVEADLGALAPILVERLEDDPSRRHVAEALGILDPELARSTFERLLVRGGERAFVGPLVELSWPEGPEAAWRAAGIGATVGTMDVVADRMLRGPWEARSLLDALDERIEMLEEAGDARDLRIIGAEVARLLADTTRARRLLAGVADEDPVAGLVRARLAIDDGDPIALLSIEPRHAEVAAERIEGLLASGEPEAALGATREALRAFPADPRLLAVRGLVRSRFDGRSEEALADLETGWRLGQRGPETMLELVRSATAADRFEAERLRGILETDPTFRRFEDADRAIAMGDADLGISLLLSSLDDPAWRSAAMARLLAAWRTSGRVDEGRMWLAERLAESPGDPVLRDASFALERAIEGPRNTAIELRDRLDRRPDGLTRRHLELVLAEIPESRSEWARLVRDRIERLPEGASKDLRRLELLELSSPGPADGDEARSLFARLAEAELPDGMRRRAVRLAGGLAEEGGREFLLGIQASGAPSGKGLEPGFVVALVQALGGEAARPLLEDSAPIESTLLGQPDWREEAFAAFERGDLEVPDLAEVLRHGVRGLDPATADATVVRAFVVSAAVAGSSPGEVVALLEAADRHGWDLHAAWEVDGGSTIGLAPPFVEIAGDVSLVGAEDVAVRILEEAVDRDPRDAVALNNLGYALLELGRFEEAEEMLEASLAIDPESTSTLDSLGWLRYAQGRFDPEDPEHALSLLTRSVRGRTAEGRTLSSEVLLHLGDASWRAGRQTEAVDAWNAIVGGSAEPVADQRSEIFDGYQRDSWGGILVPSAEIAERIEGRWRTAARRRLEALAAGEDPPLSPTIAELRSGGRRTPEPD